MCDALITQEFFTMVTGVTPADETLTDALIQFASDLAGEITYGVGNCYVPASCPIGVQVAIAQFIAPAVKGQVAGVIVNQPNQIKSERIGDYSVEYAREATGELMGIDNLRRLMRGAARRAFTMNTFDKDFTNTHDDFLTALADASD